MDKELKPCPFCGTIKLFEYPDGDQEGHMVLGVHKPDCYLNQLLGYKTWEEAIAAWNTRSDK